MAAIQKIERLIADNEEQRRRLLAVMAERDSYRFRAEQKMALRRELEELLGMEPGRPASDELFREGVERLRAMKDALATANADNARLADKLSGTELARDELGARAEKAEAEASRLRNELARLNGRTNWICSCGGTDCAGQLENARLQAEIERWRDSNIRLRDEMEHQARRASEAELALKQAQQDLAECEIGASQASTEAVKALAEVSRLTAFEARLKWLHTGGERDADGCEWGVFRVKWDKNGQPVEVWQTCSDFSDLDREMARCAALAGEGKQ